MIGMRNTALARHSSSRRIPLPRRMGQAGCAALLALSLGCLPLAGCGSTGVGGAASSGAEQAVDDAEPAWHNTDLGCGWNVSSSLELSYAQNFSVDFYDGGFALVCVADGARYLVVPEGAQAPDGLSGDIAAIQQPAGNIYMVAANVVCLFDALDAIDTIGLSGIMPDHCPIESFNNALKDGTVVYAGKYNAPDYERIVDAGCPLAVESTMINHSPEVKEKLESLGVTVFTEQSSYEPEALGRLEWIKVYGVMLGKLDAAEQIFDEQKAKVDAAAADADTGKTVAFFYINSNGSAVTRKSGDYVPQMIRLAGGDYIFSDLGDDTATSTVTLEMEDFYATAKDADVIIYNSTIDGGVSSLDELVSKNPLLEDFKAVQNGDVWVTDQDMYQEMTNTGTIVSDLHDILSDSADAAPTFFKRLS